MIGGVTHIELAGARAVQRLKALVSCRLAAGQGRHHAPHRAIIINLPHNPTGATLTRADLDELADLAA